MTKRSTVTRDQDTINGVRNLLALMSMFSPPRESVPFDVWRGKERATLERRSTDVLEKINRTHRAHENYGLVYPAISHRTSIILYAGMLKTRVPCYRPVPENPPARGIIQGMSPKSRKRMMEGLACWKNFEDERGLFITLTYHETWGVNYKAWKRDMDVLIKRMKRAFHKVGGLWKLEFQTRGAPHFHLLICGDLPTHGEMMTWITNAWGDIAHSTSEYHGEFSTNVRRVWSRRHAMHYCAKYMTKDVPVWVNPDSETGELEPIPTGRIWAFFGNVDRTPVHIMSVLNSTALFYKQAVITHLVKTGSRFAERLSHMAENRSWSVFGIGGATAADVLHWRDFMRSAWSAVD